MPFFIRLLTEYRSLTRWVRCSALLVLVACGHSATPAALKDQAEIHRRALDLPAAAGACRGVAELLAGRTPRACVPGPAVETVEQARRLHERLVAVPASAPAIERLWIGVNGRRAGTTIAWILGARIERTALEEFAAQPELRRRHFDELKRVAALSPEPTSIVHAAQWEGGVYLLEAWSPEIADDWFRRERGLERAIPWTPASVTKAISPLRNDDPLGFDLGKWLAKAQEEQGYWDRALEGVTGDDR